MNDPRKPAPWTNVAALFANAIALLIINLHPVWRPWTHGIVTDAWAQLVWAANLSAGLQVAGNALMLQLRSPLLARVLRFAFSVAALVAGIVFYVTWPLDFSRLGIGWLDGAARVLLILALIGASLAVVADLLRLAFPRPRPPRPLPIGGGSGYI